MDEASRQLPPLQTWPGAQAEQPPQWSASLLVGTAQAVPHSVSPSEQAAPHALLLHTWPDGQAVVQSPQWVASGGTQAPLQSIPDTHWHAPPWQIWPAEQGMPQPPQLFASAVTGMHC
jgi:hypothetical protein